MMNEDDDEQVGSRLFSAESALESLSFGSGGAGEGHPLGNSAMESSQSIPFALPDELVEPPSYADALFMPLADSSAASSSVMASAPERASNSGYMTITVTDPVKRSDGAGFSALPGGSTYVTYLVTYRTDMPQYSRRAGSVRRRFRDFVTLADKLAETQRGYFIPSRPDKSVEGQVIMSKDFIEQRRKELETYMNRLAQHPVLAQCDLLKSFVDADGEPFMSSSNGSLSRVLDGASKLPKQLFGSDSMTAPPPTEAVQPAKGNDLLRLFKELKQSMSNDWQGNTRQAAYVEEEPEFVERKARVQDLEKAVIEASQRAELLCTSQQALVEVIGEVGLALIKLAKFQEDEPSAVASQKTLASDCRRVGTAAVRVSRLMRTGTSKTVDQLQALHEYLAAMPAVRTAMQDRQEALVTVQTLAADAHAKTAKVQRLEQQATKVFGGDKHQRKIEDAKRDVAATEASRDAALQEFRRIQERNKAEFERFDTERQTDFCDMLIGFVKTQVAYTDRCSEIWQAYADELDGVQNANATNVSD
eukprot:jgi/Chlat1/3263/Chrsp22S03439